MEIPQTHQLSVRKLYHTWYYCEQNISLYYQPQRDTYNLHQQYPHDRGTRQSTFTTQYCRDKVGTRGNIHSGILSPDILKTTQYSIGK